jgi:serine phosphatase RsbU (regulator of sigma subunit)
MDQRQINEQLDSQQFLNVQAETISNVIAQTVARVSKSATMGFAAIDFKRMTASILLAGHPPIVLIRDGRAKFIQNRNDLFGFTDRNKFKTETIEIKAKDRLIFYTDGLIEHPTKGNLSFRYMKNYFERGEFSEETIENDLLRLDKFEKKGIVDDACVVVIDIKDSSFHAFKNPPLKKNA